MGELVIRIFDVEHGACTMLMSPNGERIAMIDSGDNSTTGWRPSTYIQQILKRSQLDYLIITNADQDHMSDLEGLWQEGVQVKVLMRNPDPSPAILRGMKEETGPLTSDIERYLDIHARYVDPNYVPFEIGMAGVTCTSFYNSYADFQDTNNLSQVVFIQYGWFKICFPGDLEKDGWGKLLENPLFVKELAGTTILVASHHGRFNGFNSDIFKYFTPRAVVISDKPIAHETQQMVPDYRQKVDDSGVYVENQRRNRHVLTTRRDGDIIFKIPLNQPFTVLTCNG